MNQTTQTSHTSTISLSSFTTTHTFLVTSFQGGEFPSFAQVKYGNGLSTSRMENSPNTGPDRQRIPICLVHQVNNGAWRCCSCGSGRQLTVYLESAYVAALIRKLVLAGVREKYLRDGSPGAHCLFICTVPGSVVRVWVLCYYWSLSVRLCVCLSLSLFLSQNNTNTFSFTTHTFFPFLSLKIS